MIYTFRHNFMYYLGNLSIAGIIATIVTCLIIVILYTLFHEKRNEIWIIIARSVYLSLLLLITIVGRKVTSGHFTLRSIFLTYINLYSGIKYTGFDVLFNMILFTPAVILFKHDLYLRSILKIMLLSIMIETAQLFLKRGLFEICDIIDNTLGGLIGLTIYECIIRTKEFIKRDAG